LTIFEQGIVFQAALVERGFEAIEQFEQGMHNNGLDGSEGWLLKSNFWVCSVVSAIVPQECSLALFCMGAVAILVLKQHSTLQSHCATSANLQ
jgi:hypothetical protein